MIWDFLVELQRRLGSLFLSTFILFTAFFSFFVVFPLSVLSGIVGASLSVFYGKKATVNIRRRLLNHSGAHYINEEDMERPLTVAEICQFFEDTPIFRMFFGDLHQSDRVEGEDLPLEMVEIFESEEEREVEDWRDMELGPESDEDQEVQENQGNQERPEIEQVQENQENQVVQEAQVVSDIQESQENREITENQVIESIQEPQEIQENQIIQETPEIQQIQENHETPEIPEIEQIQEIQQNQPIQETPEIQETQENQQVEEHQVIQETQDLSNVQQVQESPEIERIQENPEIQEAQTIQESPEIQESHPIQENPEIQETQEIQQVQEIQQAQKSPEIEQIQENPEIQEAQTIQEIPEIHQVQDNQQIQENPEIQEIQPIQTIQEDSTDVVVQETKEIEQIPANPEIQETPEVQQVQKSPEIQENQQIQHIQENPEFQENSTNEVIQKNPEIEQYPANLEIQETPEVQQVQEIQETQENQEIKEIPQIQKIQDNSTNEVIQETKEIQQDQVQSQENEKIPESQPIQNIQKIQETPEIHQIQENQDVQDAQMIQENQEIQVISEIPQVQETPETQEIVIESAENQESVVFEVQKIVAEIQETIAENQEIVIPSEAQDSAENVEKIAEIQKNQFDSDLEMMKNGKPLNIVPNFFEPIDKDEPIIERSMTPENPVYIENYLGTSDCSSEGTEIEEKMEQETESSKIFDNNVYVVNFNEENNDSLSKITEISQETPLGTENIDISNEKPSEIAEKLKTPSPMAQFAFVSTENLGNLENNQEFDKKQKVIGVEQNLTDFLGTALEFVTGSQNHQNYQENSDLAQKIQGNTAIFEQNVETPESTDKTPEYPEIPKDSFDSIPQIKKATENPKPVPNPAETVDIPVKVNEISSENKKIVENFLKQGHSPSKNMEIQLEDELERIEEILAELSEIPAEIIVSSSENDENSENPSENIQNTENLNSEDIVIPSESENSEDQENIQNFTEKIQKSPGNLSILTPTKKIFEKSQIPAQSPPGTPTKQASRFDEIVEKSSRTSSPRKSDSNGTSARIAQRHFQSLQIPTEILTINANLLKTPENLENFAQKLVDYSTKTSKSMCLVTIRDLATLTDLPMTAETVARITLKKKKVKVMKLAKNDELGGKLAGILKKVLENVGGAATWIHFLKEDDGLNSELIAELHHSELKKIAREFYGESSKFAANLAGINSEFLALSKDGYIWFNAGKVDF